MTASDADWNPEPARLREGEHPDESSHAARNSEQLAMAREEIGEDDRSDHDLEGPFESPMEAVEAMAETGPVLFVLHGDLSRYLRYREGELEFDVIAVDHRRNEWAHSRAPVAVVGQWIRGAEATAHIDPRVAREQSEPGGGTAA